LQIRIYLMIKSHATWHNLFFSLLLFMNHTHILCTSPQFSNFVEFKFNQNPTYISLSSLYLIFECHQRRGTLRTIVISLTSEPAD
jgi:hypothetical protein